MSSIFGAFSRRGDALEAEHGLRMERALAFRPADAVGIHSTQKVCLGVRALQVTPESAGAAPPHQDSSNGCWCVADVRLDARPELARTLGLADGTELADEQLILAAYTRWGAELTAHLLGDFAFALWDERHQVLLLARDPVGTRALYYGEHAGVLSFASQPRALLAQRGFPPDVDGLRVAQYLAREFVDDTRTFFAGISRLPPGHQLRVARTDVALRRYFTWQRNAELPASSGERAEAFRARFVDAVRVRTRSRSGLGCCLSGGLDSAGLYGALRALAPERSFSCHSARFPDFPEVDEGEWLATIPGAPEVQRCELRADRLGPLEPVAALGPALDEPFFAPNLCVYVALAAQARAHGSRVLLDGLDGDTVVDHGFAHLRELLYGGRVRSLAHALFALRRRTGLPLSVLVDDAILAPERERMGRLARLTGLVRSGYLKPDFACQSGYRRDLRERASALWEQPVEFRDQHLRALTHPILTFYLEVHDKVAATLGIDHRHPYFDARLMAFCLALPPTQRLHDGWDRVIQRRAFAGLVPEGIRSRQSKSVWSPSFRRQLWTAHGELIQDLLGSERSALADYCDLARMRRDLSGLRTGGTEAQVLDLWAVLTLGAWLAELRL